MAQSTMQLFASARSAITPAPARRPPRRGPLSIHVTYRARLAALRERAPDSLRERILRELRAMDPSVRR